MKIIIVKWIPCDDGFYKQEMRVVLSNHERFTVGYRFDFGFMQIASNEGYFIQVLPMIEEL